MTGQVLRQCRVALAAGEQQAVGHLETVLCGEGGPLGEVERAHRVADYFELAELMARDALNREESAGGHFREEYQSPDGEALRDDADYAYVAAWEWTDTTKEPELHKEELKFENVELKTRSYA